MAKQGRLLRKTIVVIEGEKVATSTTGCRERGGVLFLHRYHPEADEKEIFL
jgi:hypothetical protein